MNITVFEGSTSPNKYLLRYRATHSQVLDGLFTIEDQDGNKIELTESELYLMIKMGINSL